MHVTESACEVLSELMARRPNTDRCLRLSTVHGAYRFVLDEPIEHDITFSWQGSCVLIVSETLSRDLWGITVDTTDDVASGKRKLIFRKSRHSEPFDVARDESDIVPPEWRASEHQRLLGEIAEIDRKIQQLRGSVKGTLREQIPLLEETKKEKWDAIRSIWAGDGGWHRRNGEQGAVPAEPAPAIPAKTTSRAGK